MNKESPDGRILILYEAQNFEDDRYRPDFEIVGYYDWEFEETVKNWVKNVPPNGFTVRKYSGPVSEMPVHDLYGENTNV